MFRTWKLLAARRDLAAALAFEAQREHEMQHLRDVVLPKIEQRLVAAEVAMLRGGYQAALADPDTPASHVSQLVTLLVQQRSPSSGQRRWWSRLRGTADQSSVAGRIA
jgi:hypothetical protein